MGVTRTHPDCGRLGSAALPSRPAWTAALAIIFVGLSGGAAGAAVEIDFRTSRPEFRPGVHDYVVSCAKRHTITVRTPGATEARINGGDWLDRVQARTIRLSKGQAIEVATRTSERRRDYWFRCLPGDFPAYDFELLSRPRQSLYMFTPGDSTEFGVGRYVAIFDRWGTPIWWYRPDIAPIDAKVLGDGSIAYARYHGGGHGSDPSTAFEIRRPSGHLLRTMQTVGSVTDIHDLQLTADGNYILLSYKPRPDPLDLTTYAGDSEAYVIDGVIQKLSPQGKLLWEWSSADHIGLAETGRWWTDSVEPYDLVHINAVEPIAGSDDLLISMRHTDAVYRIDGDSGAIVWKLGGEPTPQSLTVHGDPFGSYPFGGQHDVRSLGNDEITAYDNHWGLGAPRAVRYAIDPQAGTATLVDSLEDPQLSLSQCCGSARFAGGAWLVSWGGTPTVAEYFQGRQTFRLTMPAGSFSYRAVPTYGATSKRRLRRGMDVQVAPRP